MPILTTKLYIPPPRPSVVHRPRLIERLTAGLHRKLTLISAPAGFGKTTLVSEWVDNFRVTMSDLRGGRKATIDAAAENQIVTRVAWLSLDEGDSDLVRFLTYLVAALQTVKENVGSDVLRALQSPQPPPATTILTALINEIAAVADHFVLVLDDYHLIDARAVDDALAFLIEHLPPTMHLIMTTREDPNLPLARLRARGQLTEVRAADLRFTPAEAADFLKQVMDLDLSAEQVTALETRTEGWIAGLQLAALSMRGRADIAQFVKAFAGDNRYIVDYLVAEVLQRQPAPLRSFLLETAILDRLSGPLCNAVTGQENGQARLEALARGNFFVLPLDDNRHWYRYHHLFADVLQAHLRADQPEQVATLHRRASAWYADNGLLADAIRHALAGADFARAADLIELAVPVMRRSRQEATTLGWLKLIPDEVIDGRPVLSVHYAGTLLQSGELASVADRLRAVQRWLDTPADMPVQLQRADETCPEQSRRMVVVDQEEFRRLPGWIAIYRAAYALVRGNVHDTLQYARQARDLVTGDVTGGVAEDDHLRHGAVAALLGLAYWSGGELEAAYRTYADGMAHLQRAGHISDVIGGAIALADIRIVQGRLREAMRIYERGLQLATEHGDPALRGTADMYVGMSELHREHNDLQAAMQHLLRSKEQGEHTGFPQNPYRWRVAMARIREAQGDLDGALTLLDEAERLYVSDFYPNVRPIAALKTRVWVKQGRLGDAFDWAREQRLSAHDNLSYLREFAHITLARVLIARYQHDHTDRSLLEAIGLLARLLQAAEAGAGGSPRTGSMIEILVLQAVAHQAQGDIAAALLPLQQALTLAGGPMGAEGYVRVFVDEGAPMAQLLSAAVKRGILPDYANMLLAALGVAQAQIAPESPLRSAPHVQALIEPLSERELAVLRLLASELSGPEIARQLMVSLNTLRTHTKNIFSKLGVNNRRAAVHRAQELDLV